MSLRAFWYFSWHKKELTGRKSLQPLINLRSKLNFPRCINTAYRSILRLDLVRQSHTSPFQKLNWNYVSWLYRSIWGGNFDVGSENAWKLPIFKLSLKSNLEEALKMCLLVKSCEKFCLECKFRIKYYLFNFSTPKNGNFMKGCDIEKICFRKAERTR